MSLVETICKFIESDDLFRKSDRLLLAISGGRDSTVMMHVLNGMGYNIGIAHVNYQLRGQSSEEDQRFVREAAISMGVDFHDYTVSDREKGTLASQNLQEVARDIRYRFLHSVLDKYNYDVICTAHHQKDNAETFFLNALRGSGWQGLRGIQPSVGQIRRPLLSCGTNQITLYAKEKGISWREDKSNSSISYNRNYIRHEILSRLAERWPDTESSLHKSARNLADTYDLFDDLLEKETQNWKKNEKGQIRIGPLSELVKKPGSKSLLYYLTQEILLREDQINRLISAMSKSGLDFSNGKYQIYTHNDHVIAEKRKKMNHKPLNIETFGEFDYPEIGKLIISISDAPNIDIRKNVEFIDAANITFPLTMRIWKDGDKIAPLGLQGRQKLVSDILVDHKINRLEKKKILVLEDSKGVIIWLIGHRLSHDVRLEQGTRKILKLTFTKTEE